MPSGFVVLPAGLLVTAIVVVGKEEGVREAVISIDSITGEEGPAIFEHTIAYFSGRCWTDGRPLIVPDTASNDKPRGRSGVTVNVLDDMAANIVSLTWT